VIKSSGVKVFGIVPDTSQRVVEKQGKPNDYAIVPPLKMKGVNEKMSWGVRI
jgi:hypothetical protein